MSAILIIGESGAGKSSSIEGLDPANTLLIQVINKDLPFRYKKIGWMHKTPDNPKGSIIHTTDSDLICQAIKKTSKSVVVIDDFNNLMVSRFMSTVLEKKTGNEAFAVYNEIAHSIWKILDALKDLGSEKRVYFLAHSDTNEYGFTRMKTIGKLLNEKVLIEANFSVVLQAKVINGNHVFLTKSMGDSVVKSPIGMFDGEMIANNLSQVDKKVMEYYAE